MSSSEILPRHSYANSIELLGTDEYLLDLRQEFLDHLPREVLLEMLTREFRFGTGPTPPVGIHHRLSGT